MKVIESRKKYYALSLIVIMIGLVFMGVNAARGMGAFSKDIEFTGGSLIQVDLHQKITEPLKDEVEKLAEEVTKNEKVSVTKAGDTGVIITMPRTKTSDREALFAALKDKYSLDAKDLLADEDVSASISNDIKRGALLAVLVGTVLILIYITYRFKDYRFGTSAVIALIHDVLIMFTVYAIFRVPLNGSFIAAMLTIVGYSINDTIVVFDRIRENRAKLSLGNREDAHIELVDRSVTQTVGRSINTSLTTIVMVVLLYVLGTNPVKEFAFPLIIGVASGTYSSIFIASPLWYELTMRTHKQPKKVKAKEKVNKDKI